MCSSVSAPSPGTLIYSRGPHAIYEVDGEENQVPIVSHALEVDSYRNIALRPEPFHLCEAFPRQQVCLFRRRWLQLLPFDPSGRPSLQRSKCTKAADRRIFQ